MYQLIKTSLTKLVAQVKITAATKTTAVVSNIPAVSLHKLATMALAALVVSCGGGGGGGGSGDGGGGGATPELNEPAAIMKVALVPSGESNFNNAIGGFADNTLTIAENVITTNSFAGYDLLIEFNNTDAIVAGTAREGASMIAVSVAEGEIILNTQLENTASDGQLISLMPIGTGVSPTAGAVNLSGATSGNFTATGVYTIAYDFALAQNLAGSARIVVTVAEFENAISGVVALGEHQIPLALVVAPSNAAPDATLLTTLGANARDIAASFTEDEVALPLSGNIPVATSVAVTEDAGAVGRTATVAFTGVANSAGQAAGNPRGKPVFTYVDDTSVSYNEHAWGVDVFNFDVTYTEPRGFAAVPITYTLSTSQDVTVTATPDPTVLTTNTFTGFRGAEFVGATDTRAVIRTANATFTDPDLAYDDNIATVLGDVTISTSAGELVFSPSTYTLTQDVTGGANDAVATLTGVSYSLSLTEAEALAKDTTPYNIDFTFDASGTSLTNAIEINFALQTANPTIVAGDAAFPVNGIGAATVAEDNETNTLVGTLTIADADLTKVSPGTFTYDIPTNPFNLVKWETTSISETAASGQIANRLVLAKALEDADVGVHTITWTVADSLADGAGTLTGNLILTVTRVDDVAVETPGVDIVSFDTPANADDLVLNLNSVAGAAKTFPITLSFNDPDFLEPPAATLSSETYNSTEFTFTFPTIISGGPEVCVIAATDAPLLTGTDSQAPIGASIIRTGNLSRTGGTALTFGNIKTASPNCSNLPIGSTLTSVQFTGVTVDTGEATTFPAFTTTPPAYVVQGYRSEGHTMTAGGSYSVSPNGATANIIVTITDGDPDDGTPHNLTLGGDSNVVRTGGGRVWAGITTNLGASTCNNMITLGSPSAYVASGSEQSTASIVMTSVQGAIGACSLTVSSEGEDGQSVTANVSIRIQNAPRFVLAPAFENRPALTADNFNYATDTVIFNGSVRSTDTTDQSDITVTLVPNDFCSVADSSFVFAGDNNVAYPFTTLVTALKAGGNCVINVTATEDAATQGPLTASFNFPDFAPRLSIVGQASPYVVSSATINTVSTTLRVSKQDPSESSVSFSNISTTGTNSEGCIVAVIPASAVAYASNTVDATVDSLVNISLAPEFHSSGGNCRVTFVAIEDGVTSAPSIINAVFDSVVNQAPSLEVESDTLGSRNLNAIPGASNFTFTFRVNATKNDGSNTPNVDFAVTSTSDLCSVVTSSTPVAYLGVTPDGTFSSSPSVAVGSKASFEVTIGFNGTLGQGTLCGLNIIATEDTLSGELATSPGTAPITIVFDAQPVQVSLDPIATPPAVNANQSVSVIVRAKKQDEVDGNSVNFRALGITPSDNLPSNSCIVSPAIDESSIVGFSGNAIIGAASFTEFTVSLNSASRGLGGSCELELSAALYNNRDASNVANLAAAPTRNVTVTFIAQPVQVLLDPITPPPATLSNETAVVSVTVRKQDVTANRDVVFRLVGVSYTGSASTNPCLVSPSSTSEPTIATFSGTAIGTTLSTNFTVSLDNRSSYGRSATCELQVSAALRNALGNTEADLIAGATGSVIVTFNAQPVQVLLDPIETPAAVAASQIVAVTVTARKQDESNVNLVNFRVLGITPSSNLPSNSCIVSPAAGNSSIAGFSANTIGDPVPMNFMVSLDSASHNRNATCELQVSAGLSSAGSDITEAPTRNVTVTFNAEPVQVLLDPIATPAAVPANESVVVNLTVIKQDESDVNTVSFRIGRMTPSANLPADACQVYYYNSAGILTQFMQGSVTRDFNENTIGTRLAWNITVSLDSASRGLGGSCELELMAGLDPRPSNFDRVTRNVTVTFNAQPVQVLLDDIAQPVAVATTQSAVVTATARKQDETNVRNVNFQVSRITPPANLPADTCQVSPSAGDSVASTFGADAINTTISTNFTVSLASASYDMGVTCELEISADLANAGSSLEPARATATVTVIFNRPDGLIFTPVSGQNGVQATGMITALVSGANTFTITDNLLGCDLAPPSATSLQAFNGEVHFAVIQNDLAVGNSNCLVEGDVSNSGSITMTGVDVNGATIGEPLVATAEQILIGNHSVTLALGNDKSYYLMEEQLSRSMTVPTSINPLLLNTNINNIYPHLLPRQWNLFDDRITAFAGFTNSSILVNRTHARGGASNYRHPVHFPYATDVFFVNTTGIEASPDALVREHSIVDPAWNDRITLPDPRSFNGAGYNASFFASMRARGVDGYLKFTSRQSDVFAVDFIDPDEGRGISTLRTFRTAESLNYMLTKGISTNNQARLFAKVCHLTDLAPPSGLLDTVLPLDRVERTTGRSYNFDHAAALAAESVISCAATNAQLLSDIDASHIVNWPSNVTAPNWVTQDQRDADGGGGCALGLAKDNEQAPWNYLENLEDFYCRATGTTAGDPVEEERGSIMTNVLSADTNAINNKLSLQIQHYLSRVGFDVDENNRRDVDANVDSMNDPSIYLIEVYPVNPTDHSIILGKPVKILFQVEPRATASAD